MTCKSKSAFFTSSRVERKACTRLCGSSLIKPTVSDSKKLLPFALSTLRTVVSKVAKSISFSNTCFSSSLLQFFKSAFMTDDFPALVYPTRPTSGISFFCLAFLWTLRSCSTCFNSLLSVASRCSICLRSSSSFFSPAPLLLMAPLPPPCLLNASCSPTSLGSAY